MTKLDPNRPEDMALAETRYWATVNFTLGEFFNVDSGAADDFRRQLEKQPPLMRALALHDHPLDMASALTGMPVTADAMEKYDRVFSPHGQIRTLADILERPERPEGILSSAQKDRSAPMVAVSTLNRFLGELGYLPLAVNAGVAHFTLERRSWKKPLLKRIDMETLPGITADGEQVYRLDRIVNLLNGLQEFASRRKPASSIVVRIDKLKSRIVRHVMDHQPL